MTNATNTPRYSLYELRNPMPTATRSYVVRLEHGEEAGRVHTYEPEADDLPAISSYSTHVRDEHGGLVRGEEFGSLPEAASYVAGEYPAS